jgi:hypothetical protein
VSREELDDEYHGTRLADLRKGEDTYHAKPLKQVAPAHKHTGRWWAHVQTNPAELEHGPPAYTGPSRARSYCRFVLMLIHLVADSLT